MLLEAGLFQDFESALKDAKEEAFQCPRKIYYFYLVSDESEDKHIGYIAYSIKEKQTAYLDAIYIDKKYRGQGLGKTALENLELMLKKSGITTIKLYVFAHNKIAFNFYNKFGYIIENTYYSPFYEKKIIGYHMKKGF